MKWRKARGSTETEKARHAREAAEQQLAGVRNRAAKVRAMAASMIEYREVNHFRERWEESARRQGG